LNGVKKYAGYTDVYPLLLGGRSERGGLCIKVTFDVHLTFNGMKNLLFLFVFINAFVFGQTDSFPSELTFVASVSGDWTTKLQDVDIVFCDETGKTLFTGITDEQGKLCLEGMCFFSGKDYTVTASTEGFYLYRKTFKFAPMGDYDWMLIDMPMEPVRPAIDASKLHFDLTVRVGSMRDKTVRLRDVRVTVTEADGTPVFEGCTDENGEVYVDSTRILPNKAYIVRISREGFYEDRNGSKFTTAGLEYNQNFVIDICPLELLKCWFYPCYDPLQEEDLKLVRSDIAVSLAEMQRWEEQVKNIRITRLAVFVHGGADNRNALLREAEALRKHLRKHLPSFTVEEEIVLQYDDNGQHDSCVGIMWLIDEEEQPQSNTR
jgi:hypothetical protein